MSLSEGLFSFRVRRIGLKSRERRKGVKTEEVAALREGGLLCGVAETPGRTKQWKCNETPLREVCDVTFAIHTDSLRDSRTRLLECGP